MNGMTLLREDELHAYVDGRLDPGRRQEVERRIAADPALRARIEDWEAQAEALRAALAPLAREPAPPELNPAELLQQQLARRAAPWRIAASVALVFALGAAAGGGATWALRGPPRPTEIARLQTEATTAWRVFASDTAQPVELDGEDPATLVRWMTQKLGRRVSVPDLSAQGYKLLGGRVLTAMYGPAAMLLYQDAAGTRLTVYLQPMSLGLPTAMQRVAAPSAAGVVDGFAWIAGQIGYSVLTRPGGAGDALHGIADQVREEMRL